jgi:RimJ/RimL family protein N-acetyltransferase
LSLAGDLDISPALAERGGRGAALVFVPLADGRMDILTTRLRLRPLTERDLDDLVALHLDALVMLGSSGVATPRTRAMSEEWLRRTLQLSDSDGVGAFRLEERDTGAFLGRCGLRPEEGTGDTEIAYALVRHAWGRGLATEAATAVLQHGFDAGMTRIVACALAENPASIRVLEKVGMRRVREETTPVGWLVRFEMNRADIPWHKA